MELIRYPTTMAEVRQHERQFQCTNCTHWEPHTKGKWWTWGRCRIDGYDKKWTCPCFHEDDFKLTSNYPLGKRHLKR